MKRRDFLKSITAMAAGGTLRAAPALFSPAKAKAHQETLLIVSESDPNNVDIHGVGTTVPAYEVSWNRYDRLISQLTQPCAVRAMAKRRERQDAQEAPASQ